MGDFKLSTSKNIFKYSWESIIVNDSLFIQIHGYVNVDLYIDIHSMLTFVAFIFTHNNALLPTS